MNTLPIEFSFDKRVWYRLLAFMSGIWCVAGFLAGVIGGHPWSYTLCFAVALPVIFASLLWLIGCRAIHRSYVISVEGIVLRRRGRDLERIIWTEIAGIRSWPLALVLRSGRRIPFYLLRAEMLRARETLLHAHPTIRIA